MRKALPIPVLLLLLLITLPGCNRQQESEKPGRVAGYRPLYSTDSTLRQIIALPVQPVRQAGKIAVLDSLIVQVETGEGIHLIRHTPGRPAARTGFIRIRGCEEVAVRNQWLYANNYTDLVVINIAPGAAPLLVKRIPNVFLNTYLQQRPPNPGYFECADPAKGIIVAWIPDTLTNPACRY